MDTTEKCSTPIYGNRNLILDFTLSEIRKDNKSAESDSVLGRDRESKEQPGSNNIQKNPKSKKVFDSDSNSDSEYETIDVREIHCQEAERQLNVSQDFGSNNSSILSIQLFRSPTDNNYNNYVESYLNSLQDDVQSISSEPIITSAVFQKRFRDETEFRTYSGPGLSKNSSSPSKISFSPKWMNGRVVTKYNLPSEIPVKNSDSIATEKSPESAGWSSRAFSYEADHLWKDFTGHAIPPSQSSTLIEEGRSTVKKPDSKYSHLRVQNEEYKIFTSPTRRLVQRNKENRGDKASKAGTRVYRKNKSPDVEHPKLANKKRGGLSPKYNAIDSAKQLGKTSEEIKRSPVVTDRNLSESRSPVPMKSKPTVISVEIMKNRRIIKF